MQQAPPIKLSICIATFNRAGFIGQALDSIVAQITDDCEIVIADNASTDDTENVVSEYARRFDKLIYFRQKENVGCDRNFDFAVEKARGEYCWLFSDDDLMKPGAISRILESVRQEYSLILVNGEHRDLMMSRVRVPSFFEIASDRSYGPSELDRLFTDVGRCSMCVCCVVIKRSLWLQREREKYFGCWFIHTAIIFQDNLPGESLVIAQPLISLRLDNEQTAETESFNVWYMSWPSLVWTFPLSDKTKEAFCTIHPWKTFKYLLALRVMGWYTQTDYDRWIRPRMQSFRDALAPIFVARLSRRLAQHLYRFYTLVAGWPSLPFDLIATMFPSSLRVLHVPPSDGK